MFKIWIVSLATSLDAFGVGISIGLTKKPILLYIISIGAWAFAATIVGLYLGKKLSKKFGPLMNLLSSVVLFVLAIQMLSI